MNLVIIIDQILNLFNEIKKVYTIDRKHKLFNETKMSKIAYICDWRVFIKLQKYENIPTTFHVQWQTTYY